MTVRSSVTAPEPSSVHARLRKNVAGSAGLLSTREMPRLTAAHVVCAPWVLGSCLRLARMTRAEPIGT